ncbi:MAG TPA: hypothetical protein VHD90_27200 [Phototrophicaceae bacterium]|nr:hypothetical protein [Phototrophicaceae bacterium]
MGIYEAQAYGHLSDDEIFSQISCEGCGSTKVVDHPGAIYDRHKNRYDLVLAFVRGSADVRVGDHVYHCVRGDKLNIPGDMPHSAVIGAHGAVYFMTQVENCAD